jgi:hypothetical protein
VSQALGHGDEPQAGGAVVAVHYGDYRRQEIWVRSGVNDGCWYPLGSEFWAVWDRQRMPAGVTKSHPTWADVLARGPVTLLVAGDAAAYQLGWRNGRHNMAELIAERAEWLAIEDPPGTAGTESE